MTYVVCDGKILIADCLVADLNTGKNILGRYPTREDRSIIMEGAAKGVDIYYNDCHKIIFPPKATHKGKKIKTISFSGKVGNVWDLLNALDAGVDLEDWFKVEVNIQPKSERRLFNGDTDMLFTLENGDIYVCHDQGKSISVKLMTWGHLGSGKVPVNSVTEFIPNAFTTPENSLTALEAFAVACCHSTTVSRKFDYYVLATDEYKQNQELTTKQLKWIMARVQAKMDLTRIFKDTQYANNIWGVED